MRAQGAKLRFYDLWSEGVKIQVMANAKYVLVLLVDRLVASSLND